MMPYLQWMNEAFSLADRLAADLGIFPGQAASIILYFWRAVRDTEMRSGMEQVVLSQETFYSLLRNTERYTGVTLPPVTDFVTVVTACNAAGLTEFLEVDGKMLLRVRGMSRYLRSMGKNKANPMTNAERQRKYRESKKGSMDRNETLRNVTPNTIHNNTVHNTTEHISLISDTSYPLVANVTQHQEIEVQEVFKLEAQNLISKTPKQKKPKKPKQAVVVPEQVQQAVDAWNNTPNIPTKAMYHSQKRIDAIATALEKEPNLELWKTAFKQITDDPFNHGKTERSTGWKAHIDWAFSDRKISVLLEKAQSVETSPENQKPPTVEAIAKRNAILTNGAALPSDEEREETSDVFRRLHERL